MTAARRVLLGAFYRVGRSPFARACDARPAARVVSALSEMKLSDVVEVLGVMEAAGVRVWVAGGWGVDALLGRPTRRHADLDLLLPASERSTLGRAIAALRPLGFAPAMTRPPSLQMPRRTLVADGRGRGIDLLPVDVRHPPFSDYVLGGTGPAVRVLLGDRVVECPCAQLQLRLHEGTPRRHAIRLDVAALEGYAAATAHATRPRDLPLIGGSNS